jgi:UDP-N-acetyl-D-mannosaminuronic acid dehydrogenase
MKNFEKKITVVGAGRVGLCLALSLEENGYEVNVCDINEKTVDNINNKILSFKEPFYSDLIKKTKIQAYLNKYPESDIYIFTVNTPLIQHIESDIHNVINSIEFLLKEIDIKNKLFIFRSTLSPNTCSLIKKKMEKETSYICGKDFFLVNAPERIVEGSMHEELYRLPQIIGSEENTSFEMAKEVFSSFNVEIIKTSFIESELSKIFCNTYRYIDFAIPNYLANVADSFGVDGNRLIDIIKYKYPRNDSLKKSGFVAGTCLRKDFGMINEFYYSSDFSIQAYKVNEFMPKFYTRLVEKEINENIIGILGYTMKKNCDDTRDSLVPKLIRYISKCLPKEIFINEPNLSYGIFNDLDNNFNFINYEIDYVIKNSNIIFITNEHEEYINLKEKLDGKTVIDIWNVLKKNKILIRF